MKRSELQADTIRRDPEAVYYAGLGLVLGLILNSPVLGSGRKPEPSSEKHEPSTLERIKSEANGAVDKINRSVRKTAPKVKKKATEVLDAIERRLKSKS